MSILPKICSVDILIGDIQYVCDDAPDHQGLHLNRAGEVIRWMWTDNGEFFHGPPYPGDTCADELVESGKTVMCCRPAGHTGDHGNPNGFEYALAGQVTWWSPADDKVVDAAGWGAPSDMFSLDEVANFEIVIGDGVAMPTKIRLNGANLPKVRHMSVTYEPGDVRFVTLEIVATDVVEVAE